MVGIVAAGLTVFGFPVVVASVAQAAGTPNVTMSETAPPSVLYGSPATVTLTATNPAGEPAGYNASFEDVLPAGVSYVAGSTTPATVGDPTILADQPAPGRTTLIWSNLFDLQPSASTSITFQLQGAVEPTADALYPGTTYTDTPSVYVNSNPRTVPTFDATGAPVRANYTGSAAATPGATQIVPISITKSQAEPEAELPRGVHQSKDTYTLTVHNSALDATDATTVTDYLPAGLELLGCGGVDNTTDSAGTNPGSTSEYPGSGPLSAGATDNPSTCLTPVSVSTVGLTPSGGDGSLPAQPVAAGGSTYTQVVWNVGNLAPGASTTLTYLAGVPLRENTGTWSGTVPTPASGAQASNLDNNNGPETTDAQSLTNLAVASGNYRGTLAAGTTDPVTSSATQTVEAVDLAIQKSDSASSFTNGGVHTYTLNYETSEYRYSTGVVVTDNLPNGMCPLGSVNYDTRGDPACAPQVGQDPSVPYTSVAETAGGGFTITWALGTLPTGTRAAITFPAVDRGSYQGSGGPTTPTLSTDGFTNTTSITGTARGACQNGAVGGEVCPSGDTTLLFSGESSPETPVNGSHASETAPSPTITKAVALVPTTSPVDCATQTYTTTATPIYQKGDTICFEVTVAFPAGTTNRNPVVGDFLPPNSTYVPGSESATGPANSFDGTTTPTSEVTWTLGTTVPGGNPDLYVGPNGDGSGQVFHGFLAVSPTADPSAANSFAITDNLAKETQLNTAGDAVSLRANATYELTRPSVTLTKSVATLDGAPNSVPSPTVTDGEAVGYAVELTNTGLVPAVDTALTDPLPAPLTCGEVSAISDGGSCAGTAPATIAWSGITVPAATQAAGGAITDGTSTLTYTVTLPTTLATNESLTNTASVTSYHGQPDNGPANTYTPDTGGSPPATGSATVRLAAPTLAKTASPTSATIGQTVSYTVTATAPAGTTVYSGALSDPLGADETYVPGSASVSATGATTPSTTSASFTTVHDAGTNTLTVTYPTPLAVGPSAPLVVTLTYQAVIADVGANHRSSTVPNTASLGYDTSAGAPQTPVTSSTAVTVKEPDITLAKTDASAHRAGPGAAVNFTVTAANPAVANASTAYNVAVTDCLPAGMGVPTGVSDGGAYTTSPTGCAAGSSGAITWTYASIAPGANHAFTYTATMPNPAVGTAPVTNNASVTVASLASGGRTTGTGYSAAASDSVTSPGATVTKAANPSSVTIGVATTYTATVTIPADTTLPNLTAIDTLPNGMTFDSYGQTTCIDANNGPCDFGVTAVTPLQTPTPAADGSTRLAWFVGDVTNDTVARTVTLVYTAYPAKTKAGGATVVAGTTLVNRITANWNQTVGPDPTTIPPPSTTYTYGSPSATAPVTVIEPHLSMAKAVSNPAPQPGQTFTWHVTVTNSTATSSAPAYDVVVNDPLPAGLSAPTNISNGGVFTPSTTGGSPGTISWTLPGPIGTTAGTDSAALSFDTSIVTATATTGETITNTATAASYDAVSGGVAGNPSRYRAYGPTSAGASIGPVFPQLVVAKTTASGAPSGSATIGTPFGWKLTVTDASAAPAQAVVVTDTLPTGWTYDTGSAQLNGVPLADPTIGADTRTLTFTLLGGGNVGPTTTDVITYTATPGDSAGVGSANPDVNTALATGDDATGATGNASGFYQSAPATASAQIASADLVIAKTLAGPLVAGQAATYDIAVTNTGPDASAPPVTVTDTLPAGATAVSGSGTSWTCAQPSTGTLTCTSVSPIASGAAAPTLAVTLTMPASTTGAVANSASVSSPTHDPTPANNTSAVTTTATPQADLAIAKSHSGTFTAGQDGTYALAVTNNGPSDATGPVTVTDTLPAGETYVSTSVANGTWTCSGSGSSPTVTCTLPGPLAAGAAAPGINLTVLVDASVTSGTVLTNQATVGETEADLVPANNLASDPTTVGVSADLAIFKTHAAVFTAGTDVTYTLAVSNLGPSDAAGPITVADTLPSTETFVSGTGGTGAQSWTCTATGGPPQAVTCTLPGPLAVTAAPDITLTVHLASGATGTISNTATVSSSLPGSDPDPANDTSTSTGPQVTATDAIGITKAYEGAGFVAGQNGVYDLTVTNGGPSDDPGPFTVTDTLPPQETYVSSSGAGWTCTPSDPTTVRCVSTTPLTNGASSTFKITVAVDPAYAGGTVTNTAAVSSPVAVTNPAATIANDPTPVTDSADLALAKATTSALTPGTQGTYHLAITNAGPSDAQSAMVTDTLPSGADGQAGEKYVSSSSPDGWTCMPSTNSPQLVTCTHAGPLAVTGSGAATTIDLVVAVDPGFTGATLTNPAIVSSPTPDPSAANNVASVTTTGITPVADLSVAKTHTGTLIAGERATYTLSVIDHGPSDSAAPITVTDTLPASETFVSASGGSDWTCAAAGQVVGCSFNPQLLAAGDTAPPIQLVVVLAASARGTLTNTAAVTGTTADPVPGNDTASDPATVTSSADLGIVKTDPATTLTPTGTTTYSLAVTSAGPSDAQGVVVVDTLPAGETYLHAASGGTPPDGWTCRADAAGAVVTCSLGAPLLAGTATAPTAAPTLDLTVAVGPAAYPSATNSVTVSASTPDADIANNISTVSTRVSSDADLRLRKTHRGTALVGQDLRYTLRVDNLGPTPDPGPVTVTDPLPAGEKLVSVRGTGWSCQASTATRVVCARAGSYPVGTATSLALVVVLANAAVPAVTNTATVAGTGHDPVPADNSGSTSVTVTPVANLGLVKTLISPKLVSGSDATYSLAVTDLGPSPTRSTLDVVDTLPAGLTYVAATGPGWTCSASGATVRCRTAKVIDVAAISTIRLVVEVAASSGTITNEARVAGGVQTATGRGTSSTAPVTVSAPGSGGAPPSGTGSPSAGSAPPGGSGTGNGSSRGGLASTGAEVLMALRYALALILGGLVLVGATRRRRRPLGRRRQA